MKSKSGLLKTGILALAIVSFGTLDGISQNNSGNSSNGNAGNPQRGNNQGGGRRQRQGNFDPAQFEQRMVERYRERLEITYDSEWKAIQPRVQKVLDARMAIESGRRGTSDRGSRSNGGRGQNDQSSRRGSVPANPAAETLQRAINDRASNADLKAAAAQYVAFRKSKQADLEKAQEELRMVLTQRQESIAILAGLL